ncbi:unnamed protein product [Paramecium sonneborni]|uniref:Uncharacterized protein n=1 Tax=Paramecium sonneborni TaxID=65129 RepID=A0A8S1RGJ3_9CILI|nr:unnamed protein product [Paramecium sonneborni]
MQEYNNDNLYHSQSQICLMTEKKQKWNIHHKYVMEIFKNQTEDYVYDFRQVCYLILSNDVGIFKYAYNGQFIRIDKQMESNQVILKNLQQLKNLTWKRIVGSKNKKLEFLVAYWKGKKLNIGGYYTEDGLKNGIWREISENYWDQQKMINIGNYNQGKKFGKWNTKYKIQNDIQNITIEGGHYNQNGLKTGKWIDFNNNFFKFCQVHYQGEYNKNKKQGIWNILFQCNQSNMYKINGGGMYDENGQKKGKWIEIFDNFHNYCQVIEIGQYIEGKKIGKWIILERFRSDLDFQIIGGGIYDFDGIKNGYWIDLKENYWQDNKVLYIGFYKEGKKYGKWNIKFQLEVNYSYVSIGGGHYNERGLKQGKWIDLHENFYKECQVLLVGEYKDGVKIGCWEFQYEIWTDFHIIGCGIYFENNLKHGKWIDLHENFYSNCLVVQAGEYQQGKRQGCWESFHTYSPKIEYKKIGGGDYDQNGMKNGQWIDLHDKFWRHCQVLYTGLFFAGTKQGKWITSLRSDIQGTLKQVGGGNYNEKGQKIGEWIEITEQFQECEQEIIKCKYDQGIKLRKISRQNICENYYNNIFFD